MGNQGSYQFAIFLKSEGVLTFFAKMLLEVGEIPEVVNTMLTGKGLCETEELMKKKTSLKEADIQEIEDARFHFSGEGFIIDIIFGKKRVFLSGYLSEKKRKVLVRNLQECEFVKPKQE